METKLEIGLNSLDLSIEADSIGFGGQKHIVEVL